MTWRASFPESVRVAERWLCDVTVYDENEKFVVPVFYTKDISECMPQLLAAVALRDPVTRKPHAAIDAGTDIELLAAVSQKPSAEEVRKTEWRERLSRASRTELFQRLMKFDATLESDYDETWELL